jgi:hypothetical protein
MTLTSRITSPPAPKLWRVRDSMRSKTPSTDRRSSAKRIGSSLKAASTSGAHRAVTWPNVCLEGHKACSRRKLRGIAAPVMPSPGYGPLLVASLASERPAAVSSLMPPLVR